MSKLDSAKLALEAEIARAKQGMAYYQSRVEILEQTLAQLNHIADFDIAQPGAGKRRQKASPLTKAVKVSGRRRTAYGKASAGGSDLPSTPSEYWLDLITETPQSAPEILKKAINSLGFEPNQMQLKKLRQRIAPALQALLKSKQIQDSGSRRERRFFKA